MIGFFWVFSKEAPNLIEGLSPRKRISKLNALFSQENICFQSLTASNG